MKTYKYFFKGFGIHESFCNIYIKEDRETFLIGFEDLGRGTSVTNASEQLASEIVEREGLSPRKCRFFEWYPNNDGGVSEIFYRWNGNRASSANWKFFSDAENNPFLIKKVNDNKD